ncbi:MAG: hypothetical protein IJ565_00660 [Bacilli bacterium]|nr:hypothetical protein [Bacilli bacterium]
MIRTDILKIHKGDIYCVLPGCENNIITAIQKGAKKIIAEDYDCRIPTVKVKNTRNYLNNYLKRYSRLLKDINIIAVSGSFNKSIAFIIYKILKSLNVKVGYIGKKEFYKSKKICDINHRESDDIYNMLLDCYQNNYKYVVVEIDEDDIKKDIYANIKFNVVLLTDIEDVFYMKLLYSKLKNNGIIVMKDDNKYIDYINPAKTKIYGFNKSDYKIVKYTLTKNYTLFTFLHNGKYYNFKTNTLGISNINNILSIVVTLLHIGISHEKIATIISKVTIPYYMESIKYNNKYIVINDIKTLDDVKHILKEIVPYHFNKIYVITNSTNKIIINYLNNHVKYLLLTNNMNKTLKSVVNKLHENNLLLIMEDGRISQL